MFKKAKKLNLSLWFFLILAVIQIPGCRTISLADEEDAEEALTKRKASTKDFFLDNGDGTVTNLNSQQIWQKLIDPGKKFTFKEALQYCSELEISDINTWRLPTKDELKTLLDPLSNPVPIKSVLFPDTPPDFFWSSSTYSDDITFVWSVNFKNGSVENIPKEGKYPVRCISVSGDVAADNEIPTLSSDLDLKEYADNNGPGNILLVKKRTINLKIEAEDNNTVLGYCIKESSGGNVEEPLYTDECWQEFTLQGTNIKEFVLYQVEAPDKSITTINVWVKDSNNNLSDVSALLIKMELVDTTNPEIKYFLINNGDDRANNRKIYFRIDAYDDTGLDKLILGNYQEPEIKNGLLIKENSKNGSTAINSVVDEDKVLIINGTYILPSCFGSNNIYFWITDSSGNFSEKNSFVVSYYNLLCSFTDNNNNGIENEEENENGNDEGHENDDGNNNPGNTSSTGEETSSTTDGEGNSLSSETTGESTNSESSSSTTETSSSTTDTSSSTTDTNSETTSSTSACFFFNIQQCD